MQIELTTDYLEFHDSERGPVAEMDAKSTSVHEVGVTVEVSVNFRAEGIENFLDALGVEHLPRLGQRWHLILVGVEDGEE